MTLTDQKQLKHLLDIVPKGKKVAIIHNFNNLHTIENVENFIEKDIYGGFHIITSKPLEKKEKKKRFFATENPNIFHCVLANKFSESGKFYNEATLEFLRNTIKNMTDLKKLIIEEELIKYLNINKEIYCKNYENLKFEVTKEKDEKKNILLIKNMNDEQIILNKLTFNPLILVNRGKLGNLLYCLYCSKMNFYIKIMAPEILLENYKESEIILKDIEGEEDYRIFQIKIFFKKTLKEFFDLKQSNDEINKIESETETEEILNILSNFNPYTKIIETFTSEIYYDNVVDLNLSDKSEEINNGILEIKIPKIDFEKNIIF